jgi:CubicO group peptidase (beta-lactamase class C family)
MIMNNAENILQEAISRQEIPGACYAFVTEDHCEFGHAGYRQLIPQKLPVEADTIYDMASCAKVIATATMILQLIEQGCFSLNTPLQKILPDFRHPEVTIEHLLTHSSGLCSDDKAYRRCHSKQEMWDFIKEMPLEYVPGAQVLYSDFGFIALGFVIEHYVGSLDTYAKENIFDPLQMKDTCYQPKKHGLLDRCAATEVTAERGVIVGECHDGKGYLLDGISGNAGLFSTAFDLSHYVQMILHDGTYQGKTILKHDTVELLKHSRTDGLNLKRTLGWFSNDPDQSDGHLISSSCIYHTGFTGTSVYIDFIRHCGIILLTNRVHPSRDNNTIVQIRKDFHDAVLKAFDDASNKK